MSEFLEDLRRGGLLLAIKQLTIRFRWKYNIRHVKELWLDEMPENHGDTVHSYAMNITQVYGLARTLALGSYEDLIDAHSVFNSVKVLGHIGFTTEELEFLRYKPISEPETGHCVLLPSKLLINTFESPDNRIELKSTDTSQVPFTVIIHYGKGEKPYWMEEMWIKARTDPEYMQFGHKNSFDPLSNTNFQLGGLS